MGAATGFTFLFSQKKTFQLKVTGQGKEKSGSGEAKKLCHPDGMSLGLEKGSVSLAGLTLRLSFVTPKNVFILLS